jgi:hypothetical protein
MKYPWRGIPQAAMWLGLAATGYAYWP